MPKTLWIDVEDLFEYAERNPRPSGIQRVSVEFYRIFQDKLGPTGEVRFVRLDVAQKSFIIVQPKLVFDLFQNLLEKSGDAVSNGAGGESDKSATGTLTRTESLLRHQLRRFLYRFPISIRYRLINIARLQISALSSFADLFAYVARAIVRRTFQKKRSKCNELSHTMSADPGKFEEFSRSVRTGDILLAIGANWICPDYSSIIKYNKKKFGIEFAFLCHDIIPIACPEWCEPNFSRVFRAWFVSILPMSDHIFTVSQYSADDLTRFAALETISLLSKPKVVTIGSGFKIDTHQVPGTQRALPAAGTYILCVSTIEARKNQTLLFRVWHRMMVDMAPSEVPTLVFAGRIVWQVADLMTQMENTNFLDRKIMLLPSLSDFELRELYRGCLFTVFPSFYEGWGLPVTESLAFGKPCVASNKTSIPEAGGKFARYFDPDNGNEAYDMIRGLISDRTGLAAWEADIRENFRPTSWNKGAETILVALGMDFSVDPGAPSAQHVTQSAP